MRATKRVKHFLGEMGEIFSAPRYRNSAWLSFLFFALLTALPLWRIFPLRDSRPFIPLHYNIYFGVDRLGSWKEVFILSALGLGLFFLNVILLTIAHRHHPFLSWMIVVATVLLEFLFFVAMCFIVLLNLSYSV